MTKHAINQGLYIGGDFVTFAEAKKTSQTFSKLLHVARCQAIAH